MLWRGETLGRFSGKCQGRVDSFSKVNGQCQTSRVKERGKSGTHQYLWHERVPTDPCPSSTHPKISQCITFMYDLAAFQTAPSVPELRKSATWVSYTPLVLPDVSLAGFQRQMLGGLHFLIQVNQARVQTLLSPETTSVGVITSHS